MFGSHSSLRHERRDSSIRLSYLLLLCGCFLAVIGTLWAVDPAARKSRKNLAVKEGPAYGKRITLRSLDLSRAPTDDELKQAGQLGGALSPEPSLEGTTLRSFSGAERKQRKEADNLLFGRAMQKWNEHRYQEAVTLFRQHRQEFSQSQWTGEVELHSGCEAQFTGRWNEAAFAFDWILNNTPKGTDIYQKARLRRSVLHMEQGELKKALDGFAELLKTETSWDRKTYAQSWIRQISQMQKQMQAVRTCGSESVAYVLKTRGKKKQSEKALLSMARSDDGFTMAQLTEFANKMGLKAQAVSTKPLDLAILPKPFIAHYRDLHYVVVKDIQPDGRVTVYDPRLKHQTLLTIEQFTKQWSGLAVIFGAKPQNVRVASTQQLRETGGCCGVPKPNDNLGKTYCKIDKCGRFICEVSYGLPGFGINPINMNLYVNDVPLWYSSPRGPSVQIELSYNSQATSLSLTPFGNKWSFNYTSYAMENPGGVALIVMPDGRFDSYTPVAPGSTVYPKYYNSPTKGDNKLVQTAPFVYDLELPDGTVYHYGVPTAMGTGGTSSLLLSITDRFNNKLTITHNSIGQIVTITDAMGQETDFTYNANGFISRIDDPFGRFCTFTYDASGNLVGQTDMAGISYTYTYDANLYMTSMTTPKGTTQFYTEPADGVRNGSDEYPASGATMWANYRVTITHPDNNKEEFYYNGYHSYSWYRDKLQYKSPLAAVSAPKTEFRFYRNSAGQGAISQVRYADGIFTAAGDFNTRLQPRQKTDANGRTTRLAYNDQGRVTTVTNSIYGMDLTVFYSYATNGWDLTSVTNQLGKRVALVTYTDKRQIATVTDALGNVTAYGYNPYGQLTAVTNALGTSVQRVTTLEYNPTTARPERVKVAGATVASYTYDTIGRVSTVTDANNYTLRYAYDGLNRLIRTTYPDGTSDQSFYSCCHVEKTIDRHGRTTSYLYDKAGNLLYTRDPANRITQFERDLAGNLTKLIDGNGHTTRFAYDARYRVARKTYADGRYDTYGYDGVGNTLTYSSGLGGTQPVSAAYAYDDLNRLTDVTYIDAPNSGVTTPGVHFNYDNANRRIGMVDGAQGETIYSYDDAGRLGLIIDPLGNRIVYSYDPLNRLTGRTINGAGNNNVTVQYDTLGRVSTLSNPLGSFGYTYSGNSSRLTDISNPNGQHTTYSYLPDSGDQRLSQILNQTVGNATLSQFNYGYDQGGQITQWTQQVETGPAQVYTFAYDATDSLLRATLVNTATPSALVKDYAYTYDKGDNRTGEQIDGVPRAATYNSLNQLTGRTAAGTGPMQIAGTATSATAVTVNGKSIAVDANGNFTTAIDSVAGLNTFTVSATDASANTRSVLYTSSVSAGPAPADTFTYDSRGNMLTGNGRTYAWDAANRLRTITYSGKLGGTIIGTSGSWQNIGNTRDKAFDGDLSTYFDAPEPGNGGWVGLDLGSPSSFVQIRFAPRPGAETRMIGGKFQASPSPDFSNNVVDLYTISVAPTVGVFTAIVITNTNACRYIRYLAPDGSYGNIAEMEAYGPFRTEFTYDGYGRWVKIVEKDSGGTVTSTKQFLWDGLQIAEERDATNAPTKYYYSQGVYLLPASGLPSPASYYYTRDHLGSIRELVDANGRIAAAYDYDPYGRQDTSLPAGMKIWLKADAGITKDGSNKVSAWADQSGNGNHVAQTNTAAQPLYIANNIHNRPALRFDGVNDVLTGSFNFNATSSDITLIAVHKRTTNKWAGVLSFATTQADQGAPIMTWRESYNLFGINPVWTDWNGVYADLSIEQSAWHVSTIRRKGGINGNGATIQVRSFANQSPYQTSGTQWWTSYQASGVYLVGQHNADPNFNTYLDGDIAEIIVYNRALTPAELTRVETYLAQKYGRNNPASDFGYTGHYTHAKSGLVLAPYRAYDPDLGRWLSRDPIEENGGINLYAYVGNDPVNYYDSLGLWQATISGAYGYGGSISIGKNNGQWNASFIAGIGKGLSAGFNPNDNTVGHLDGESAMIGVAFQAQGALLKELALGGGFSFTIEANECDKFWIGSTINGEIGIERFGITDSGDAWAGIKGDLRNGSLESSIGSSLNDIGYSVGGIVLIGVTGGYRW